MSAKVSTKFKVKIDGFLKFLFLFFKCKAFGMKIKQLESDAENLRVNQLIKYHDKLIHLIIVLHLIIVKDMFIKFDFKTFC